MDDLELLKNLLSLSGVKNQKLCKTLTMLESVRKINKDGFSQESVVGLLSQYNPKLKPLVAILKNEGKKEGNADKGDSVQYNRPYK